MRFRFLVASFLVSAVPAFGQSAIPAPPAPQAPEVLAVPPAPPTAGPATPVPPLPPRAPRAYQGRSGPEQTERFSRKVKIGREGRVTVSNISGSITVNGGSGDEVAIDAVKHGRGSLADATIDVDERPGRVDVRTGYVGRNNIVSVDYTLTVPATVGVELHSVSGDIKVTGVRGGVRAEAVSGTVATSNTPHLEVAKSVSGDIDVNDAAGDADVSLGSVSGNIRIKGLKARGVDLQTVSGDATLADVILERFGMRSVSGGIEFTGPLAKSGRYDINTHSGEVRLMLAGNTGFELMANTFSGSIRSGIPLILGGADRDRRGGNNPGRGPNRAMQATFGDGSAQLTIRTFSGDVVIEKR